eukprot:CAMPEP_0178450052 /NCGR_PEP_ID=MMETSP0689_2-20121128/42900_1 /TAXON_ID=160604 /ORGANISM="Amphidinium massartii, Strain CS-259" /LENGTH=56 /DNA_ID=CAMNT_0020075455 /DNA_START=101 /DNA_END=269 /DNA_ORIENTATION=+
MSAAIKYGYSKGSSPHGTAMKIGTGTLTQPLQDQGLTSVSGTCSLTCAGDPGASEP